MLTWWAVGTGGATAVGGLAMAAVFLTHNGMAQSEREAIGPRRVLPHIGFAVVGFGLWVAYAITDTDALGWAGMACLVVAFAIAGTFLITRDQHRRADLAQMRARPASPPIAGAAMDVPATATGTATATVAAVAARPAIPAERFIPIWMASAHGLLGGGTLVLVLLERAGVS
jgi:hypothetical protein